MTSSNTAGLRALETELRSRLLEPLPGPEAQRRFAPHPALKPWDPAAQPPAARHAAALLLLYPGSGGPSVVLTKRHAGLPHHGGQVSLPGGALHGDETPVDAALREAHEEIGLNPDEARVVGALSTVWVIVSEFIVHPIIAIADARPAFSPSPREVESLIETPLVMLRDPARLRSERRVRLPSGSAVEVDVSVPYFDVQGHQIWGATAMILGEFLVLLDSSSGNRLQFSSR